MNAEKNSNPDTQEAQIVVIGAGGGGLPAAVTAAEKGFDVLVLEKLNKTGGNAALAGGLFGSESRVQKRFNIDAPNEVLFKMHMDFSHWEINPRLVRALIDKSGDSIAWLEDMGVVFVDIVPHWANQNPLTWHCPKGRGTEITDALTKTAESLGVRFLFNTTAHELITDGNDKVTGVLATHEGQDVSIKAGCVIISTGGFGGNKEMLKKYSPTYREDMHLRGLPHMGEGILMAMKVGAATEGLGTMHTSGMYFPDSTGRVLTQQPNTVWVNNRGERYIDEGVCFNHFVTANAIVRQPGSMSYTLLDDALIQYFAETGFIKGVNRSTSQMVAMKSAVPGLPIPDLKEIMQASADKGDTKISDSWDEIAEWMGAKPEALKAEIEQYNSFCDKGHDEIFAKERRYLEALRTPPYYAMKCGFAFPETLGGLKINHHMEVINKDDYAIPGLYAAGVDTGGWEPHTFNLNLTGSPLGFSVSGGRIAAESAVKYLSHAPTN